MGGGPHIAQRLRRGFALSAAPTLVATTFAVLATALPAHAGSLYSGPGPRPGPDILYEPLAKAPQLTNGDGWDASPILVSGASAYRKGEFLYQDFLYDDHGANARPRDPNDPRVGDDTFSEPNGTYTYPTDDVYADNAADLVELRVRPGSDHTRFRITYNTLNDPDIVATTIAIGGDEGEQREFPHGANARAPADLFLTVHGDEADLIDAETDEEIDPAPTVEVDERRRQVEIKVSDEAWDPRRRKVRLAAGTGLWDTEADAYLIPQQSRTDSEPGGAGSLGPSAPAFFNVAFRFDEPSPTPDDLEVINSPAWWRDRQQGEELEDGGDLSDFHADVDFDKLRDGENDDMRGEPEGIPKSGPMNRILASHFETQPGADYESDCGSAEECKGWLRGQLQPYAIYVPSARPPDEGYGMTLLLHSLGANYNQYLTSRNQSQLGERGPGSIVITPAGRGPDGWYYDHAGADTFEVWADVAKHYDLDPKWTTVTGYSMGGYGTFKFATQFPDLFAKAQTTVGPPGLGFNGTAQAPIPGGAKSSTYFMLPSVRNVPFLMWAGAQDQLVPVTSTQEQAQRFDSLGYRYDFWLFNPAEHLTLALNDEYGPVADFLGKTEVDRNPAHVTYVRNPTMDFSDVGTTADHAYWLDEIELRDEGGDAPRGEIDVRSLGFGEGDPDPGPTQFGAGTLTGGNLGALPFTRQFKEWGQAPDRASRNRLVIDAENIATVTVNVDRAKVTCNVNLDVQTDGPLTVRLKGCSRVEQFDSAS